MKSNHKFPDSKAFVFRDMKYTFHMGQIFVQGKMNLLLYRYRLFTRRSTTLLGVTYGLLL